MPNFFSIRLSKLTEVPNNPNNPNNPSGIRATQSVFDRMAIRKFVSKKIEQ